MELSKFIQTLERRWIVPAVLLVICIGAVATYHRLTYLEEAQATVAVLDPLTARPGSFIGAQVTFDSIIKSDVLAERVSHRIGIEAPTVKGRVSASVLPSLGGVNLSPLYAVRAKAKTRDEAVMLTNVVVEEGRRLYFENNVADVKGVRDSLADEHRVALTDLAQRQDALASFETANNAMNLTLRLQRQVDLVASLRSSIYATEATENAVGSNHRGSDTLRGSLAAEQRELDRLMNLAPEYDRLYYRVTESQLRLQQLNQSEEAMVVGQVLPADARVKILDHARVQSQLLWLVLTYSVGVLVGLLLGFTAIYVMGSLDRTETPEGVGLAIGAPVLVRIPRGKV